MALLNQNKSNLLFIQLRNLDQGYSFYYIYGKSKVIHRNMNQWNKCRKLGKNTKVAMKDSFLGTQLFINQLIYLGFAVSQLLACKY